MISALFLSPHPDDICFSSFLACALPIPNKCILTVFSQSRFWINPCLQFSTPQAVSDARLQEERAFASAIGAELVVLGLTDTSVRYAVAGIEYSRVPAEDPLFCVFQRHWHHFIAERPGFDTIFVPLGISEHIDHLICRDVVMSSQPTQRIVLYEDLPYVAARTDSEIQAFAVDLLGTNATSTTLRLTDVASRSPRMWNKRAALQLYINRFICMFLFW
jgi:deacetylase